ncbi:MAG: hypothetical protein EOP08_15855, partial [Proteobacteria bacterium]
MFRSSAPESLGRAQPTLRGPSGTSVLSAPGRSGMSGLSKQVIPGTAPVPDFARGAMGAGLGGGLGGGLGRAPAARPTRDSSPASLRRLNKCMFLEYDEREHRWRDALNRTGRVPAAPVALKPRRDPEGRRDSMPPLPMSPPVWCSSPRE